ncbi:hypothetical protein ACIBG0_05565 [Nocardia sp. NPDC050630]|uniref:hypothetical protein n=1 Tax=Nocardia sp. NPDC050630 TaxID=3364321 RepID=UPI00378F7984
MTQIVSDTGRFGHREHLLLTWLTVRGHGVAAAIDLIGDGLRRTTRYQGVPRKYNATVSRAWVESVGYHMAEHPDDDFLALLARNPALLDKRLLTRFYHPATLATGEARTGWVPPDRARFPWM